MQTKNLTEAYAARNLLIQELEHLEDARQEHSIACEQGRADPQSLRDYREVVQALKELEEQLAFLGMEVVYYEAKRDGHLETAEQVKAELEAQYAG